MKDRHPPPIRWEFPRHVPTIDFLEGLDLDPDEDLDEAVENFISGMAMRTFLTWEAVVCKERGLRLTRRQKEALEELISFEDSNDEEILYIDELPRPSEPWYAILNRIAPHLLVEPFRTFEMQWEVQTGGWSRLVECLEEHAESLSLPVGAASPLDVVPPALRHKLALQSCFTELEGIGQEGVHPLEEDTGRIDRFIARLRSCKESVAYLELTLDSLCQRLILPDKDGELLVRTMREALGIQSTQDPIAGRL
ncbi:MAG: hypothetical protein HY721_04115 [Planctomycetes bacterium]|nr:hypothetical protein [Planctomycetota bacterium]